VDGFSLSGLTSRCYAKWVGQSFRPQIKNIRKKSAKIGVTCGFLISRQAHEFSLSPESLRGCYANWVVSIQSILSKIRFQNRKISQAARNGVC
jgi:hypothetical protein